MMFSIEGCHSREQRLQFIWARGQAIRNAPAAAHNIACVEADASV
ncbi:hypothetical protein GL4_1260 [Methyloceanibacter caenitepidi]|uniref:Uncharacterized protein n=1 Tax=Methyloceanibacter caenitepidi TaxID=1384459 RepID=A0A0A8K175_9HYPH|nr:hypothetical protein GL4_1260 [Methyloceanibacter caenitepidi]